MANSFTPQQIEQFLQEFFDVVGARQYVGARYVPIFGRAGSDTVEWDDTAPYEPLTVVMHQGVSYVSRRYVPAGVAITDTAYWVETYRFNAQVEQYRQEVLSFGSRIDGAYAAVEALGEDVARDFVPFPDSDTYPKYGTTGQVLSTLSDGSTKWEDPVVPSDEQAEAIITTWLDDHPEATTTVQDGAITDPKISASSSILLNRGWANTYASCDDITHSGIYYVSSSGGSTSPSDFPFENAGILIVASNGTVTTQLALSQGFGTDITPLKSRMKTGSYAWSPWRVSAEKTQTNNAIQAVSDSLANYLRANLTKPAAVQSCDDLNDNGFYFISSSGGVLSVPDFPFSNYGWLFVVKTNNNITLQLAFDDTGKIKFRRKVSTYGDWVLISGNDYVFSTYAFPSNSSCDDVAQTCIAFVGSAGGQTNPTDFPLGEPGWLFTKLDYNQNNLQIAFPWYNETVGQNIMYRTSHFGTWGNWIPLGGETTTIVREVSNDTFNNTYNISTTPTITTSTNGWLQAVDDESTVESSATDMTGAIMSMLNGTGYCKLSEGTFYVSGGIDIPEGATLEGCGRNTIVRLLQSSDTYICRVSRYATVRDIRFSGGKSDLDVSSGNIGNRHAIYYIGNRNGQHPDVTPNTGKVCIINSCWFENLDSGIYGYNSGGGLEEGLIVSDCYMTHCMAGVNLEYWCEYCKFTNVITFHCHWGAINNGGNNVFIGCTFHATVGFLIDNSGDDKPNSAHGSAIGCTFNHIDNWNNPDTLGGGIGVHVLGTINGFIFNDCQFWYSKIRVENSKGIKFSNCEMQGGSTSTITVVGSTHPVIFTGNMFMNAPAFTVPSNTVFDANRLATDGSLVSA